MSSRDAKPLPPGLHERLQEEAPEEQNELVQVWHLLEAMSPWSDDVPDAETTWIAVQERLQQIEDERTQMARNGTLESHVPRSRAASSSSSSTEASSGDSAPVDASAVSADHRRSRRGPKSHAFEPIGRTRLRIGVWTLALVLLGVGVFFWRQPVTVTAPSGQQVAATLPDGSTVELNSGTTLSYRRGFQIWPFVPAVQRRVRLEGEAFFDVQPGDRPFVVETFNARIEVLGTAFNVRARADVTRETQVMVARGRVRVMAQRHPEEGIVLAERGQSSRVTEAAPTPPQLFDIDRALVWRRQGFAVTDAPLSVVVAEIERRYDVQIQLEPSALRSDGGLSLFYPQQTTVETILHDIATARGLKYRPTSRGYEIYDDAPSDPDALEGQVPSA